MALLFLLVLASATLKIAAEVKPLKFYNSFINANVTAAIKAAGALWEPYEPDENPLRMYTERELRSLMSMPGVDYDEYLRKLNSLKPTVTFPDFGTAKTSPNQAVRGFTLPLAYDWRTTTEGARCKPPVMNQGICGSCYSFSTVTTFSARYCQQSPNAIFVQFSPQNLLACNARTMACSGGVLDNAQLYLEQYGVPSHDCQPYAESNTPDSATVPSQPCNPSFCYGAGTFKKYYCKPGSSTILFGSSLIKNEIYKRGPVTTMMTVYQDLISYKSGVYKTTSSNKVGAHGVVLVGWGYVLGLEYWIVQNSWGSTWGESGYFKADMSDTKSQVGNLGYYCIPDLS